MTKEEVLAMLNKIKEKDEEIEMLKHQISFYRMVVQHQNVKMQNYEYLKKEGMI